MSVLSFVILDDLTPAYGPVHVPIEEKNVGKAISEAVAELVDRRSVDPTSYYIHGWEAQGIPARHNPGEVEKCLRERGYYCLNRYEKYYVVAFALDYKRFEVFSKDCSKELIKWRVDDADDPVVGRVSDPEYNLNPVIRSMSPLAG